MCSEVTVLLVFLDIVGLISSHLSARRPGAFHQPSSWFDFFFFFPPKQQEQHPEWVLKKRYDFSWVIAL